MDNEYIRQGETFEVTIKDKDTTAETLTVTVSLEGVVQVTETENFTTVDDVHAATVSFTDPTLVVGEYDYMYTIVYDGGRIEKFPDISECEDGDCELPKLIVCEANDIEES